MIELSYGTGFSDSERGLGGTRNLYLQPLRIPPMGLAAGYIRPNSISRCCRSCAFSNVLGSHIQPPTERILGGRESYAIS